MHAVQQWKWARDRIGRFLDYLHAEADPDLKQVVLPCPTCTPDLKCI